MSGRLAVRWTIGDVSPRGFQALRLSLWGAWRSFGEGALLAVCVNTVSVARARELTGDVPSCVQWFDATYACPSWLSARFGRGMAEGVAWKLAPLRLFPDDWELSLDNDCILWDAPDVIGAWLAQRETCLLASDVRPMFGHFDAVCGTQPLNAGIRGLPPGFDLEGRLREALALGPQQLDSELDEQGLQVAALSLPHGLLVVPIEDVSICSPFPPHLPGLGQCGAHFCGLNARAFDWTLEGRPAEAWIAEHWDGHLPSLSDRVGIDARPLAR